MAVATQTRPTKSQVHPCRVCGERPVWKDTINNKRGSHSLVTCKCGTQDMGPGPKWLGVIDWNAQNP